MLRICPNDGSSLQGVKVHGNKSPIHMVSEWANSNDLVLGQLKVNEKSNEITVIPKLLDAILIQDCTINIDAMGCQIEIANKVIKEGENYISAVKGNQKNLQQNIEDSLRFLKADHGRVKEKTYSVIRNLEKIENSKDFKGIKSIADGISNQLKSRKIQQEFTYQV